MQLTFPEVLQYNQPHPYTGPIKILYHLRKSPHHRLVLDQLATERRQKL